MPPFVKYSGQCSDVTSGLALLPFSWLNSLYITNIIIVKMPQGCCCCCLVTQFVWLFVIPQTVTHQASLSMGFPRQEYKIGLPCPSLGDLSELEFEPMSSALAGRFFTPEPPGNPAPRILGIKLLILLFSRKKKKFLLKPESQETVLELLLIRYIENKIHLPDSIENIHK